MKLLMISGDRALAQGKEGAFYSLLKEFSKHWSRIDIICPAIPDTDRRVPKTYFNNVFVHPSPWPLIFQPLFIFLQGRRIIREHKPAFMTVHEYPPFYNGKGARLLHWFYKIPYILEIMHVPGVPKADTIKEWFYRNLARWFISLDARSAKAVRVINKKQTPDFLVQAGVPRSKIIYIPAFYIDLDVFKPQEIAKRYDLIFVGRLVENKGVDLFLNLVKQTNQSAIIVGDGPLRQKVELFTKNHSLNTKIFGWAKDASEIARLMNESRVLVMPSYNEGGPRVVLEAMACGVPVVATPVGIVPDVIVSGESGSIVAWNVLELVGAAKNLLNDVQLYEKYRQAGLTVARRFEYVAAIKNYADELKKLI